VLLGCRLFFEARLSSTGDYSCASCHQPRLAFTDGRALALGATGETVRRGAMSLANVAYTSAYTWASSTQKTLESQMAQPLFGTHPVEMGLARQPTRLLEELADEERYASAFRQSFPGEAQAVSMFNTIKAIAAFERTLISGRSAFDRYIYDDERGALNESATRGMALFYSGRVGCSECHSGFNLSGAVVHQRRPDAAAVFANTGLYNVDGQGSYPKSDMGLIEDTGRASDMGKFRVPTLRNIALTAPYMHDGSIAVQGQGHEGHRAGCHRAAGLAGFLEQSHRQRICGRREARLSLPLSGQPSVHVSRTEASVAARGDGAPMARLLPSSPRRTSGPMGLKKGIMQTAMPAGALSCFFERPSKASWQLQGSSQCCRSPRPAPGCEL